MPGARGGLVVALGALGACYQPTLVDGQACSETLHCPHGQVCDLESRTCVGDEPAAARFVKLDAGFDHSCGIDAAGEMWCWGDNAFGQLGTGDDVEHDVPTRVIGDGGWTAVTAGENATCGLRGDALFCWGSGGDTGVGDSHEPVQIAGAWLAVSIGAEGFCAVDANHQVFCKLGAGAGAPTMLSIGTIVPVAGSVSAQHGCVIDGGGALYCWGANDQGQVGDGTRNFILNPKPILAGMQWLTVAAAQQFTCAIDTDNGLWCWGQCDRGQTGAGAGDTNGCPTPAKVGDDRYVAVDAAVGHTCAVRADGALVCFGSNFAGQLGDHGDRSDDFAPVVMPVVGDWTAVSVGDTHSCGLRAGGEAWCWGGNRLGQLGDGHTATVVAPAAVAAGAWRSVAVGRHSTCGVQLDGTLWCWGMNPRGQLGSGSLLGRNVPQQVTATADWTAVAAGAYHTCAVRGAGELWCWGGNDNHALGDTRDSDSLVPERIDESVGDYTQVSAGLDAGCGLHGDQIGCWGAGFEAKPVEIGPKSFHFVASSGDAPGFGGRQHCGIENTSNDLYCWNNTDSPFPVDTSLDWDAFSVGLDHGCGISTGKAWCWGANDTGQLGNGGTTFEVVPQPVMGPTAWQAVSAGNSYACGLDDGGALYCWGRAGALGVDLGDDGMTNVPVHVGTDTYTSVAAAPDHACAIRRADQTLWCWGFDDFGELGLGGGGSDRPLRVAPTGAP